MGGFAVAPAPVSSHVTIDGVVLAGSRTTGASFREAVPGGDVVSVHTYVPTRGIARFGMSVGGEVIMAQAPLAQMRAASVRSVIVAHVRDAAIEAALARHADFEVQQP